MTSFTRRADILLPGGKFTPLLGSYEPLAVSHNRYYGYTPARSFWDSE